MGYCMGIRALDHTTNIDIVPANMAGAKGVVSLSGAAALTTATAIAFGISSLAF